MRLSLPPETRRPFVGCHCTHLTSHPCPDMNDGTSQAPPLHRREHKTKRKAKKRTCPWSLFPHSIKIPKPDHLIITTRRKPRIIRTPAQPSYGLSMTIPHRNVIHIRLKVLYDTRLVSRDEEWACMVKLEGSNGWVVCLEDRLKVEGETIPEGELAASWSG